MGTGVAIRSADAKSVLRRYQRDPVAWGQEVPKVRFSAQQKAALRMFVANLKPRGGSGKMLVKSGHNLGKTWLAAFIALWFVSVYPDSIVLMMSSSGPQVKERLFAEFRRMYRTSRTALGGTLQTMSFRLKDPDGKVIAVSPANPDNFQGEHAEHLLIVFDEAQAVDRGFWEAAEGMIGSPNGCQLGILNPLYTEGMAFENWKKTHEWVRMTFNCLEHENVVTGEPVFPRAITRQWVEDRKIEWGEDSPLYQARVLGEWPMEGEDSLLTLGDLERAADIHPGTIGSYLGQDVARFGSDLNVLSIVVSGRVVHMDSWGGLDTMQTTGRMIHTAEEYDVPFDCVNVDGIGIGAGVVDRCREQGHRVNDINFGAGMLGDWLSLTGTERFKNRRSELHWVVRMMVKQKMLCIPRKFSRAWADLLVPKYSFTSKGEIAIESKDDIRSRTGRSPDFSDSVILSCARGKNAGPTVRYAR